MIFQPTPLETQARFGLTHILSIGFADMNLLAPGYGTGVLIPLWPSFGGLSGPAPSGNTSASAGLVMSRVIFWQTTQFAGGTAPSTLTISVGDTGSGTRFVNAQSVISLGGNNTLLSYNTEYTYPAATQIGITIAFTGSPSWTFTSGSVQIGFGLYAMSALLNV